MRKWLGIAALTLGILGAVTPAAEAHRRYHHGPRVYFWGPAFVFRPYPAYVYYGSPWYYPPPVVYAPPPVVYTPPPEPGPAPGVEITREVVYPHGKYVLHGDGVTEQYRWEWVPNPAPGPR